VVRGTGFNHGSSIRRALVGPIDNRNHRRCVMERNRINGALAIACAAGLAAAAPTETLDVSFCPPEYDPRIDPVTAGVAAGLIVGIITGISSSLSGDGRAQVWASVKADGPDGDDIMSDEDYDKYDNWFGLEWDLDAATGVDRAPNGGEPHTAWADCHFTHSDGAWRPNTEDYLPAGKIGGWVENYAHASPDTTPVPDSTNDTGAASVSLFAQGATIIKRWTKGDDEDETPRSVEDPMVSTSAGGMFLQPGQFTVERLGAVAMVSPDTTRPIELFHDNARTDGGEALYARPFFGITRYLDEEIQRALDALEIDSTFIEDELTARAELTLAGAAVDFRPLLLERFFPDGTEKTDRDLFDEYVASPSGMTVIAPEQAQAGYVPNVVSRVPVSPRVPVDLTGEPTWMQALCPEIMVSSIDPQPGGDPSVSAPEMWGVIIGVEGTLDDALHLAAGTPGTPVYDLVTANPTQETFDLSISVASTGGGAATSEAQKVIDPWARVVVSGSMPPGTPVVPGSSYSPIVGGVTPRHSISKLVNVPPGVYGIASVEFGVELAEEALRGMQEATVRLWAVEPVRGERFAGGMLWAPVAEMPVLVENGMSFTVPAEFAHAPTVVAGEPLLAEIEGGAYWEDEPLFQRFTIGATLGVPSGPDFYHDESLGEEAVPTDLLGMPGSAVITVWGLEETEGCGPADLNGDLVLDLSDVNRFVQWFVGGDQAADLTGDGVLDLSDIVLFVDSFVAGCP
jgi:hypothetical protein